MNKWLVLECLIIDRVIEVHFEINQKSNAIHNVPVFYQMQHQKYYSKANRKLIEMLNFHFCDVFNRQNIFVKNKLLGTGK